MTLVMNEENVELCSDCTCVDEMDDSEFQPSVDCYGCWDDSVENFETMILEPWLAKKNLTLHDEVAVYFNGVTWQRYSGKSKIAANQIIDALKINGDFILRFKLKGNSLTCVRSSHDEHGASFKFLKN